MNYLAHLYLADRSGHDLAGAILGDVVRGSNLSSLPDAVAASVRLHRRIDAVTDRHAIVKQAVAGYGDGRRRFAPIVLDVVCDHLLTLDWARHSPDESLSAFCSRSAKAVSAAHALFAEHGGWSPTRLGFESLLRSYSLETGVDLALRRMALRMKHGEALLDAAGDWREHAQLLRPNLPLLIDDLLLTARSFSTHP